MAGQGLQGGFLKTPQVRHHQPTQHDIVAGVLKIGLERSKQTRYFLGQPGHPGHGWPRCRVGKIGFIHPSPYRQGGWPASRPAFSLLARTRPKREHNHFTTLINPSSLSKLAAKACKILSRFVRIFPIGKPRFWLSQGRYYWLGGKPSQARQAWQKGLTIATQLAMPYEQALAHYEIGRHLEENDPDRQKHLGRAGEILTQC